MAALVYFRKVFEDATAVCYTFGEDPGEFSRYLTVEKASRVSTAEDGEADYLARKAWRKINAMRTESGRWPDRGMSAS